ncbi:MAG: DMT family transporter [Clostridium sp.]
MNNYKGILFAILSSISFAIMPIFAKIAYKNGSNSTTALLFRFLIAGIILLLYLLANKISIKVSKKQFLLLILIGMFGYTVTTITLFVSYNFLDVGLATTLHYIYPALVCVFSFILYKEKITRRKLISLVLSITGVYSLIAFESKTLSMIGVILALLSGLGYAINVISLSFKSIKNLDNRIITMYICFGASIGMIIYGLITNSIVLDCNTELVISYLGLSVISTIASMLFLLKAIAIIGSTSASILGTFESVISIILGIIFLNEKLTFALILGTALIIISTIILAKEKTPSCDDLDDFNPVQNNIVQQNN